MAGNSNNIRAGGAFIEILAHDGPLRKGLDQAARTLKVWGDGINALGDKFLKIGLAAIVPLTATSKVFAGMGDALAKASTRTGVAVEELSALAYAAEQSGSNLEGLETGLRMMSKTVVEAAKGGAEAVETLASLGLTIAEIKGLKPDEVFVTIADRIARIQDPLVKAAMAMKVFGKSGTSLIPLMNDGAEGINALTAEAERLGLVWSTQDAKAAEEFGDRLDDLWKVVKRATAAIGSALVPTLRATAIGLTVNIVKAMKWIETHRELVALALKISAGVVAAGAGMFVLGRAMAVVSGIVGGLNAVFAVLSATAGVLATVFSTVLFSGIGLILTALVGLGAYLVYASDVGRATLGALGGYFADLGKVASDTIKAVFDAIRGGRWDMALKALMKGMKAEWLTGIEPLRTGWAEFVGWFNTMSNNIAGGLVASWSIVSHTFTDAWREMTFGAMYIWSTFAGKVREIWDATQGYLSDKWLELMNQFEFLSDDELAQAKAMNAKQTNDDAKRDAEDLAATQKKLIDDVEKRRKASEADRRGQLEQVATENQRANDAARDATRKAISDARKEAEAARAYLEDVGGSAARAAKEAEPPEVKIPELPDLGLTLENIVKTIAPRGVTAAFDLQSLQSGQTLMQQQLDTQKKIEKNTRAPRGGLVAV